MKTKRSVLLSVGGMMSLISIIVAVVGLFWTPYDPEYMDVTAKWLHPSLTHLMGTDNFGRDIFSRVMTGTATSLIIAFCVCLIGCVCGLIIGSLCGYFGGLADSLLMRICDSITAFPSFLLALVIISIAGNGTYNIILVLGILFIPSFARMVRSDTAKQRELNYVYSAKLMGVSNTRIIIMHILPNVRHSLVPSIIIGFNNAILSESSMSFLGIGVTPPQASLGSMLSDSQTYINSAPWYAISVGASIAFVILGFSLLAERIQTKK